MSQRRLAEAAAGYVFILPALGMVSLFLLYSIGSNLHLSFFEWNGIDPEMTYVGPENYRWVLSDRDFYTALRNVFIFMLLTVPIQAAVGLLLAVLLQAPIRGKIVFRAIFFAPVVLSPVVIALVFQRIYETGNGYLNVFLRTIGLESLAHPWLADPDTVLYAIIAVNVFQWMGFSFVVYYTSLLAVPRELYEAAALDGGGFWQSLLRVTIPSLRGTHYSLVVLGTIGSIKTFDIVWLLTGGGPGRVSEFLTTMLYRKSLLEFDAGYAATLSVLVVVLSLTLSILQLRLQRGRT